MAALNRNMLEQMRNLTMMACKFQLCNYRGDCVMEDGLAVCKCWLGYAGKTCGHTVNKGLSAPLTIGVIGVVLGFVLLAFALACVHQKSQGLKRKNTEKEPLGKNGEFYTAPAIMGKNEPPSV